MGNAIPCAHCFGAGKGLISLGEIALLGGSLFFVHGLEMSVSGPLANMLVAE